MKKVILFICLLFSVSCIYSQNHLKFMNIPIDGKLSLFVKKLKEQGYTQIEKDDNSYFLKGKFAGEDVFLRAVGSVKTETIWKVIVTINIDDWSALQDKYFSFKSLYKKKYGKPEGEIEFFKNPNLIGSDSKLQAIMNEDAIFASFFEVLHGSIMIRIEAIESKGLHGYMFGYLSITYEDAINAKQSLNENLANKLDDI